MKRPVWLFSMDSEQFIAPPTTTAALKSYFLSYGETAAATDIELVHFHDRVEIDQWYENTWAGGALAQAQAALRTELSPVIGFSFYTWNAAEFLELLVRLKRDCPELLAVAGGPHVQQAEDYLGTDPLDIIVLGEGEVTVKELLDADSPEQWPDIPGLAYLSKGKLHKTAARERCQDLDQYPSPLDVLELSDKEGQPLYESISYETSRGCPFRCAFCEWGTGAIGGKMYQWSMQRIRRDWRRITDAGIKDLWLADSNFGALKQDYEKAEFITELKQETGLPLSFATSWSKKHSRKVQEIALLLHRHQLLPHYQLALQTLTPEALRLSNRQNMSSNQYEPIAKQMSEQGVPIAAELIWGLPGDNLTDFEHNLDQLIAVFPNINIFGYTLLPGTEFYEKRKEYQIEAVPVAGYGKAKGEYVVGCHSFSREEGEQGYLLISAHIILIHGHIMPLTTRLLALLGDVPVSPLLRQILADMIDEFSAQLDKYDSSDRMQIYERRNELYLTALQAPAQLFARIAQRIEQWLDNHQVAAQHRQHIMDTLNLDALLCPRTGNETTTREQLNFDALSVIQRLAAMEPPLEDSFARRDQHLQLHHPGGVGEILLDADGGSWLTGSLSAGLDATLIASA